MQTDCSVPYPDPALDEETTDWITLHSLVSLKLTLDCIIRHCMIQDELPLNEFPLKTEVDPPLTQYVSPFRTLPSRARLRSDQLSLKMCQLKSTMKLYEQHIHKLRQGSREFFGDVRGHSVFLLVDTSELHAKQSEEDEIEREEFVECRKNLQQLFEEQLSHKKKVYLFQLGSDEFESTPTNLNFRKHKERSMMIAEQWIDSIRGSGNCRLLTGLEKVHFFATSVDTLLIVMGSRPSEDRGILVDYMKDRFTRTSKLHIHWVAHGCSKETRDMLVQIASETGAQYHSYCKSTSTAEQQVEDSEIDMVTAQLQQAQRVYSELEGLNSGKMSDSVMHILIQLNIAHCQFGSDSTTTDLEQQCLPISSTEWLKHHSLNGEGLSIYSILAPNAYPQLNTVVVHSPDKHTVIPSVIYDDTMLQFTWHDGTQKYLHVDVHLLEKYQVQMEAYIAKLQQRLNWLASDSRAPFGVIAEKSVLLVIEFSSATLPIIDQLQNSMQCLLNEQISHCKEFDIMRIGSEDCSSWQHGFIQPTLQSISEAWVWLLSQSPSGSSVSLIPALDRALTGDTYLRERDVGVYLILNSMPKENIDDICSFVCEKTARQNIYTHVVHYRYAPPTVSHAIAPLSFEKEKCYVNDQELTHYLQQIASAGKGRFHSFKGPNSVSGNDIDELIQELRKAQDHLKMAGKILNDYRTFCKRCVPSPLPPPSPLPHSKPPPLYPHTNTTFLSRLNATASRRISRSASDSHLSRRHTRQTHTLRHHTRRTKTYSFYLETAPEQTACSPKKTAQSMEFRSISEWLLKYNLESLGLNFNRLEVQKHQQEKTYRHINKKGEIVELYTNHHGLKHFLQRVKQARDKYLTKLGELSKGWHHFYGCITESKVLFLIDVSSSMTGCFKELQTALIDLLQNLPHTLKYFNMMAYSSSVRKWQETLVPVISNNVDTAIQWLHELKPDSSSCLLHALKLSLNSGVKTIYLITDGTADHTHDFLISQLPQLRVWYGNDWKINTIACHCTLESSYKFMKLLAHSTNGRYHSYPWEPSLSPPQLLQNRFLGDDIRKLAQEIVTAEDYTHKASFYL